MRKETRQKILLAAFAIAFAGFLVSGMYYGDAILAGLLGALAWSKKLFTVAGLLSAFKKLPLVLLMGGKKLFLKLAGGLLLYSARTRFRAVRRLLVRLKLAVRRLVRQVRFHWQEMALWERALFMFVAVPLSLFIMALLTVLAIFPRALRGFALARLQESTVASVIDRAIPRAVRTRAGTVHRAVRGRIRSGLQVGRKEVP